MNKYLKMLILIFLIFCLCCVTVSALSKMGSMGDEVLNIQSALKNLGYYTGRVDGIYGTATKNAVIAFQRDNGLTADGIVGTATMKALGINSDGRGYNSSDYALLARIISAEARGESYLGQVAVGAVVLNRVEGGKKLI